MTMSLAVVLAVLLVPQSPSNLPADCAMRASLPEVAPTGLQIQALRSSRIEDAARVTGVIVDTLPWGEGVVTNLASMAGRSTAIVVPSVVDSRCFLSSGGRVIFTHFRARVVEAMKGEDAPGEELIVEDRGGRVVFADGSVAETRVRDVVPMRRGARYLLFLAPSRFQTTLETAAPTGQRILAPTSGAFAVFELAADGRVNPALTVSFGKNVSTDNRGRPVEEFLAAVRALSRK
jgi:hypothetical protein